jgi:glycosyltransferase involved in cell wall biosynthesis
METLLHMALEKKERSQFDLSIVIPVYADTIKLTNLLASYHRSFQHVNISFEIILVDNNSPNAEAIFEIVRSFCSCLDLTFVMQPKLSHSFSLCSARNRGVLNARGRFIFFTDSDCLVDQHFAARLASVIKASSLPNSKPRIYTGERIFVEIPDAAIPAEDILERIPEFKRVASASNYGLQKDRRFPWIERLPHGDHPWNFVHGCFLLLEKHHYLMVGGSDTAYDGHWGYEEIDLVYRMATQISATIHYLNDAKVFHQEFQSEVAKAQEATARTNKSLNPNYIRICERIPNFDDFKKHQWQTLKVQVG